MLPIDFLYRAAQLHGHRVALEDNSRQVSYEELVMAVNALALALQERDPTPGSRVGLCGENSLDYLIAMLAILAAGKVWAPLNYRSAQGEIQRIREVAEPTTLIVDDIGEALVGDVGESKIHLKEISSLSVPYQGKWPVRHEHSRDDTQAIKFTSGTTGTPKGVMQPYRAWLTGIINQIVGWQITADDAFVISAPISHGTGTYIVPMLAQGARLVLCKSSAPSDIAHAFEQHGGTMTFMPPTLIYKLMATPGLSRDSFPKLRLLIYGGAPMPVEKIMRAQDFFGEVVATTYGQTEVPQIATLMRPQELSSPELRSSVGRVTWLSELAIISPEGQFLKAGELGEVCIRGELVMSGYWKLPDKTKETIKKNWLHTGDVGYVDKQGYLFLKERIRDVIITGGFNVYPTDVENTLSSHPAVHEASVFGLPDDTWGETVNAAVQLKPSYQASSDELKAYVRERLGPVLTPKDFYFYDSLPRSSAGKVLKNVIRQDVG